ncbi:nuclear transport factor 2 family protein [Luteibaculum oceani]|uniref:Nuclear transport factor 2 family protein n=1 Tax=Luteibaculum oceani TaxID=1294296 RepID=A0A5C6VA75_9FLAO|nr:nuclear transport factor 2 family protein [Luteibaculum oceani]TXC82139.1 nuclear transport factor 2 family protein [Luteibaculum oceani]
MSTEKVANRLVELCRKGDFETAMQELYSPEIVSIEPEGSQAPNAEGIQQVIEKAKHFADSVEEFHKNEVSDPVIAEDFFSVQMKMDVTFKGVGRTQMEEICVYGVKDGKITYEQFFYTPAPVNAG